ncbi:trehalose-phosphatase [Actinotalea sp. JY-7876]|uniref:trehalose-phosphatase n=2 Tax=unclassified Actinotalea TaxID=2638618 RepID=UPI001C7153C9|nr:trehalose-phosphatase [Actinotalea sp. JY-7876]
MTAPSPDAAPGPALSDAVADLARRLADGEQVLVALDFDGVLAPLVDDPAASRPLPAAVTALERLAGVPGLHLALVSGRAVADLAALARVPEGTWLTGSHGAERGRWTRGGLERVELELEPAAATRLADLAERLTALTRGTTARVEHKPASVVLHTRTATPQDAAHLTDLALALGGDAVDAMRGKDVVELAVLRVTKGDALATLREETGASVVLYAGDDVTDERAFVTLREDDVTVKVGEGATAARFRVRDPEAVADLLTRLADAAAAA